MNFFDIGTSELILIFIIALIVVGPRRLLEMAQGLGKIMNDLRKMSQEFTTEMSQELSAPAKEDERLIAKDQEPTTKHHLTKDHPINDN